MCQLCKKIERRLTSSKLLDEKETRQYLDEISAQMKSGKSADHFQNILDQVLGTEMSDTDQELDAAWEASRKTDG